MIELTDEVLRIEDPAAAARRFARLVTARGTPRFAGPIDGLLLRASVPAARLAAGVLVGQLRRRVRGELSGIVLDAAPRALGRAIRQRHAQGFSMNINPLGEAVLGDEEASARLAQAAELLARPEVSYLSVKAGALCANLDGLDPGTPERIAEAFGQLCRTAARKAPPAFVNLDMEEYADLWPTVRGFMQALGSPDLQQFSAGIVVQAYLPDSGQAFGEVAGWARTRAGEPLSPLRDTEGDLVERGGRRRDVVVVDLGEFWDVARHRRADDQIGYARRVFRHRSASR